MHNRKLITALLQYAEKARCLSQKKLDAGKILVTSSPITLRPIQICSLRFVHSIIKMVNKNNNTRVLVFVFVQSNPTSLPPVLMYVSTILASFVNLMLTYGVPAPVLHMCDASVYLACQVYRAKPYRYERASPTPCACLRRPRPRRRSGVRDCSDSPAVGIVVAAAPTVHGQGLLPHLSTYQERDVLLCYIYVRRPHCCTNRLQSRLIRSFLPSSQPGLPSRD